MAALRDWMHATYRFLRGALNGWNSLRVMPYEQKILDAVYTVLDEGNRNALRSQLASIDLIQREHLGRLHLISIDKRRSKPIVDNHRPSLIVSLKIGSEKGRSNVKVEFYRGYLKMITFSQSTLNPTRDAFSVLKVSKGGALSQIPDEIDREEHG
jgi:hypothetical protein